MSKSISHSFHDNTYRFTLFPDEKFELEIYRTNQPTIKPEFLYKYYSLTRNSVSSLLNSYLFASHPLQLNDKYDCSEIFVDVSGHSLEDYLNSFLIRVYTKEKLIELFENHREELDKEFLKWEQVRLFQQFGIISLCENYNDILMWSYYSQNNGYLVKFKTNSLPKDFLGPYPINYVDEIKKIDSAKKSPILAFLYQTNVKNKLWKNESEWRYIVRNPKGEYHPFYIKKDLSSRFHNYDKNCVEEINLGYDFILPTDTILSKCSETKEYIRFNTNCSNHKLKRKILSFIFDNNIPCFRLLKNTESFRLGRQKIEINRISSHRYEFYLGEIVD